MGLTFCQAHDILFEYVEKKAEIPLTLAQLRCDSGLYFTDTIFLYADRYKSVGFCPHFFIFQNLNEE